MNFSDACGSVGSTLPRRASFSCSFRVKGSLNKSTVPAEERISCTFVRMVTVIVKGGFLASTSSFAASSAEAFALMVSKLKPNWK